LVIREGLMGDFSAFSAKPRLRLLLDHFSQIMDTRQSWEVAYPLREVLFLVVCATIANCDDSTRSSIGGDANLAFPRGFSEFYHGIPCVDWLRSVMNRLDPDLFRACFSSWAAAGWPDKLGLVSIDGKTSRAPRFPKLTTIGRVERRIERGDKIETERRSYISSRALSVPDFAAGVRGHVDSDIVVHGRPSMMLGAGITRLRCYEHHQFEGRRPFAALTTWSGARPVTPSRCSGGELRRPAMKAPGRARGEPW
jgi:hypothetical protein